MPLCKTSAGIFPQEWKNKSGKVNIEFTAVIKDMENETMNGKKRLVS